MFSISLKKFPVSLENKKNQTFSLVFDIYFLLHSNLKNRKIQNDSTLVTETIKTVGREALKYSSCRLLIFVPLLISLFMTKKMRAVHYTSLCF